MLTDILTKDVVRLDVEGLTTPEEVIHFSGQLLVNSGKVKETYIEKMEEAFHDLGPYMVMAPGIAMPHARPSEGAKKLAMSMLCSKERIYFNDEKYANLIIVLSSVDGHSHINALVHLSNIFEEEETLKQFMEAKNAEEVVELIRQYEEEEREGV